MRVVLLSALLTPFLAAGSPLEIIARGALANTRGIAITSATTSGASACNVQTKTVGGDKDVVTLGFGGFQGTSGLIQCNVNVAFTYTPTSGSTSFTATLTSHGFATVASGQSITFGQSIYSSKTEKKATTGENQQLAVQTVAKATFDGKGNGNANALVYINFNGASGVGQVESVDIALS